MRSKVLLILVLLAGCAQAPAGQSSAEVSKQIVALDAMPRCPAVETYPNGLELHYSGGHTATVVPFGVNGSRIEFFDTAEKKTHTQETVAGAFLMRSVDATSGSEMVLRRKPDPASVLPLALGDRHEFTTTRIQDGQSVTASLLAEVVMKGVMQTPDAECVYPMFVIAYSMPSVPNATTWAMNVPLLRMNVANIDVDPFAGNGIRQWDMPERVVPLP